MVSCVICGPKLSVCCAVLSVWGIVMLALLGIFYQIKSPALFEDIPLNKTKWEDENYNQEMINQSYEEVAVNCFIASGIYVVFFFFSLCQQRMNARLSYDI